MASWEQFKQYVHSNLKVNFDEGDVIGLVRELYDGRHQGVVLARITFSSSDGDWVQISSPIGQVQGVDIEQAARAMAHSFCGGIVIIDDLVCVAHCVPLANLDGNEFFEPLKAVYAAADGLEEALTGHDTF